MMGDRVFVVFRRLGPTSGMGGEEGSMSVVRHLDGRVRTFDSLRDAERAADYFNRPAYRWATGYCPNLTFHHGWLGDDAAATLEADS
jgi:hypothetical protein